MLEGCTECAITAETALVGQLLGGYRLMIYDCLVVEIDEVLDAQTVDVGIVCDTLQGKVLTEVGTVDANLFGELRDRNVVLKIKLRFFAMLLQ